MSRLRFDRGEGVNDQDEAARLIAALVSPRCGIVTSLFPQTRGPEEPTPPHLWNATLAHFSSQPTELSVRVAGGKGRTEAEAKLSALGEAIERYGSFHWDPSRMRVGTASADAITPLDCVLYADQQYAGGIGFSPWQTNTQTTWITGTELPSNTPVEMPAAQVYGLGAPPRIEDFVVPSASNGLAAGRDLPHAILSGLHEVIERDAFMLTWLNKLPARKIKPPQSGCHAAAILRHYEKFGVQVRLFWLNTDQAPYVIMAVAEDPKDGGIFRVVGLGCEADPVVAVDKAMFELCQLRAGMRMRMQEPGFEDRLQNYADVKTLNDHPLFHAIPSHATEFDFLDTDATAYDVQELPKPPSDVVEDLIEDTVAKAVQAGARVAYADITPPDIAALGPRVVRVIVTGFQPIHFGHGQGRLGGRRLYDAPVAWGLRDKPLDLAELNQCPHPLA